jgi:Tol biopolymer transport system component/actin-like ATPase involved in cell morphogenesis
MYTLGIDLGTTYSAAAIWEDGRTQAFDLGERSPQIPSVVAIKPDGEVLVGEAAERRAVTDPTRTAREFKRRFGDPTPLVLGGVPFGVEALQAQLVRAIVQRVRVQRGEDPAAIALTHPANYGPYKQDLLREVLRLAEVPDAVLLTEPQAAAIHYATQAPVAEDEIVAVYDFGGGTFDATLLRRTTTGFEMIGQPEGLERLGGIDFDHAVYAHVTSTVGEAVNLLDLDDPSHQSAVARLRDECRSAKEALSSDTDVAIPVMLPTITTEVRLTRREFENMIRPRVEETIACLRRVMRDSGVEPQDIGRILLVGGSSRIPLVGQLVTQAFERPVVMDAHPKFAVSMGAARHAASTVTGIPEVPAPPVPPVPPTGPMPAGAPPPSRKKPVLIGAIAAALLLIAAIAFFATRGDGDGTAAVVASDSSDVSTDTSSTDTASSDEEPVLSESTIVFASNRNGDDDLYSLDVDEEGADPVQLHQDTGFDGVPAISHDRRFIAYEHADDPTNATGPRSLMIMRADGSGQQTLDADISPDGRPSWSPDDTQIVYPDVVDGGIDLTIITIESLETKTLVTDPEVVSDPSWSPDGTLVTFTKNTPEGQQVFVVPVDESGPPSLLINDGGAADADWSPDGSRIVYDGQRDTEAVLAIVNADGSDRQQLFAADGGFAVDPFWAPDDDRVVFTTNQDGNTEIYVINADGSDARRLTENDSADANPTW